MVTPGRMTWVQQIEYKTIDCEVTTAQSLAEWQCCKFKMGQVPWSPALTKAIYWVLYWKGIIISRSKGCCIGSLVLCSRAKKGGSTHTTNTVQLPVETLQLELKKVYTRYHCIKNDPNSWDTG